MIELFEVGDILVAASNYALARKIKITGVFLRGEGNHHLDKFEAEVIDGIDTTHPITVYRGGWHLYRKE